MDSTSLIPPASSLSPIVRNKVSKPKTKIEKMIRLGTRGSALALWQANWIAELLRERSEKADHRMDVEIVEIRTSGDESQSEPVRDLGTVGVFTKEIQSALLDDRIDIAVHSLKDLPTEEVPGLVLGAVPVRGPFRDVVACAVFPDINDLPDGATVGTGSVRRAAQLRYRFPNRFRITEIRGNVDSRLKKLNLGEYDAIVLAEAGLTRLGLQRYISTILEPPDFLPAVGQGAIGLEVRESCSPEIRAVLKMLNDPETFAAVSAERALLKTLRGGCSAPIAAYGCVQDENEKSLTLHGRVFSQDGTTMIESHAQIPWNDTVQFAVSEAVILGEQVAHTLFEQGAEELIKKS